MSNHTWLDTLPADKLAAALDKYAARPTMAAYTTDARFGLWLTLVDRRVTALAGVGVFDLADWNMRDAFDAGATPKDAAIEALQSDDTFAELFEDYDY
jgi:hypothetical protein